MDDEAISYEDQSVMSSRGSKATRSNPLRLSRSFQSLTMTM
jgi:hypothetical protein